MKRLPPAFVVTSQSRRQTRRCGPAARRGVILLVVLSMLMLFAVIGVTFLLVASQFRRSSRADSRAEQGTDDFPKQLDEVFGQVVRGTTLPNSSVLNHDLLTDMYGTDGVKLVGTAATTFFIEAPDNNAGQLIDLAFEPGQILSVPSGTAVPQLPAPYGISLQQIQSPGYFNGCVLTALDGPAANQSTRIVGWGYNGTTYTMRVMAFDGIATSTFLAPGAPPTHGVLINGRPFNGTGFGFNPSESPISPSMLTLHDGANNFYALMPHAKYSGYNVFANAGGPDEDYDAVDPQNMLLAGMPVNPTGVVPPNPSLIVPSLHRPDLIAYWKAQPSANFASTPLLQRQVLLRPIGPTVGFTSAPDHPNFTGSNPGNSANPGLFDPISGPWDVDNDGDGIADSVWVDVGFTVQTAPDGRRFKPLAAILCLDLDGRLNVNAHGSVAQLDTNYSTAISPGGVMPPFTLANFAFSTTPTSPPTIQLPSVPTVGMPRGMGYGPAEINLAPLVPVGGPTIFANPATDYKNFYYGLTGTDGRIYEGRYGKYVSGAATPPLPGGPVGNLNSDDVLAAIKRFDMSTGYPTTYFNYYTNGVGSNYVNSPSDLWGRSVVAVDYAGLPVYSFVPNTQVQSVSIGGVVAGIIGTAANENPNDPYTLNLSRNRVRPVTSTPPTAGDNPFTAGELERILRRYDIDVTALPDRLRQLVDPTFLNPNDYARMITTDSFDLPSPSSLPTRDAITTLLTQGTSPTNLTVLDLLRAKLIANNPSLTPPTPPLTPLQLTTINNLITGVSRGPGYELLPPEILAGQRFDLNRPFGNGQDDDNNGVVDEPSQYEFPAKNEAPAYWTTAFGGAVGLDLTNDGTVSGIVTTPQPYNDLYARQQYAKFLYILMMLFTDQTYSWSQDPNVVSNLALQQELTARRIAQWAVNVVDFRDPDSIMTPFEYDVNPFNGWDVDGILGSADDTTVADRRLVWGCENPELLLTETLAFHDRRVKDTPTAKLRTDPAPNDPDLDQVRVPQGSLFLELYCPRRNMPQTSFPRELYDINGRLNLGAMAPPSLDGNWPQYPVWRVAITQSRASNAANDLSTRISANPDTTSLDPVPTPPGTSSDSTHLSVFDTANSSGQLKVERLIWFSKYNPTSDPNLDANIIFYNKLGTSTLLTPGQYAVVGPRPTTYLGRTLAGGTSPQRIDLDTTNGQVTYVNANATAPNNTSTTYSALPIICSSSSLPTLPTPWAPQSSFPNNIGVSVSEPLFSLAYYPAPDQATTDTPGLNPPGVLDTYSTPKDKPQDSALGVANAPLTAAGILAGGPHLNYKTALLQRLANPLSAFHPTTNPYITVDWQPIDLTVFNGEAPQQQLTPPVPFDPDDPPFQPPGGPPATLAVGGHERGSATANSAALWNLQPSQQTTTPATKGSNAVFDYNLNQSLGYLNKAMGTPWASPPVALASYTGAPDPTQPGAKTFPWLTWNNRPFTSNTELLLVPATSAEQLMRQFTSPANPTNPYLAAPGAFQSPYQHLLNFTLSGDGSKSKAPYFYRMLEYVHVPSRFVGTETYLKPTNFSSVLLSEQSLGAMLHPPFNKVSTYREPGRVNINTIPADTTNVSVVWNGILNGWQAPQWQTQIYRSVHFVNGSVTPPAPGTYPSQILNPFRSAGGAAFGLPYLPAPALQPEVNVTFLRPDPITPTSPLFGYPTAQVQPYTDPDRNAAIHYQNLQRIGNLLTTRSNVYAVWITVGYFEVTPNPGGVDVAHTDGYQLGQELGSDSGDVKRHRAFYIYDRTIPVGFEPGRDHNIDKGILVKRFIE